MSNVELILNGEYYRFQGNFHLSDTVTVHMDLSANERINTLLLFIKDPRINISSIIYASNISFDPDINDNTFGSLTSSSLLNYTEYFSIIIPIDIITWGKNIIGITLFLPTDKKLFLRELKLQSSQTRRKEVKDCPICFERKETIYIDSFHSFCVDCLMLMRGPDLCPICRQPF